MVVKQRDCVTFCFVVRKNGCTPMRLLLLFFEVQGAPTGWWWQKELPLSSDKSLQMWGFLLFSPVPTCPTCHLKSPRTFSHSAGGKGVFWAFNVGFQKNGFKPFSSLVPVAFDFKKFSTVLVPKDWQIPPPLAPQGQCNFLGHPAPPP